MGSKCQQGVIEEVVGVLHEAQGGGMECSHPEGHREVVKDENGQPLRRDCASEKHCEAVDAECETKHGQSDVCELSEDESECLMDVFKVIVGTKHKAKTVDKI